MAQETKHLTDEADIGSGEKSTGQKDVEKDVLSVKGTQSPPETNRNEEQTSTRSDQQADSAGKVLQSGNHLARIVALRQPDGSYEAQVYVRLTREPKVAETYIPAGNFTTEAEAWAAAEQRARRAFQEHEF